MPRVRLAAVPLLAVLLPLTAGAMGLGEIQLRSALNQPFVAEIPVSFDASEDPGQLNVQLAPAATFQRFGVDRPGFLDDLSFRVEHDAGRTVIRVTSRLPASEPFLSMLLDVTWPQGRLLREYTVLLDPPAFRQADTATGRPAIAAAPPVAAGPAPRPAPIQRADAAASPVQPVPVQPAGKVTTNAAGESSYGPVQSNETLWAISARLRTGLGATSELSVNQMMMALYRANPEAFAGNINRLHKGAVLRVPSGSDVAALSGSQATAEVLRQDTAWHSGEAASEPPTAAASTAAPARLQLVPPTESSVGSGSSGNQAGAGGDRAGTAADRTALERELAEKERLLNLKDDQLKALQDRVSQLEGGESPPAGAQAPEQSVEQPAEQTTDAAPAEPSAVVEAPPAAADATKTARRPATDQAKAVRAGGQPERSGFDTLLGLIFNIWFLVAAAAVLLAGTIFVFGRRRMMAADVASRQFETDLRGGGTPSAARTQPALRRDGYSVEEGGADRSHDIGSGHDQTLATSAAGRAARDPDAETPLERTISTEGAVELDQADVVAEAEFHMAYGLYDQAAELLTRALATTPGRRDLRLKLLEVYFIWENKAAFLKEAQAYKQQLKGADDPNWNKIVIMGKQICPAESLFAGAVAGGSAGLDLTLADDGSADAAAVDISFDGGDEENLDLDLTAARQGPASDLLDFDPGSAEVDGSDADLNEIDFSIDDTNLRRTVVAPGHASAGHASAGQTSEVPTIEAPGPDDYSPTTETPTLETPAVQAAAGGSTLETPTLESAVPGYDQGFGRDNADPFRSGAAEQTEEINLEDLGLDLTGLDEIADELGTGVHDGLEDDADPDSRRDAAGSLNDSEDDSGDDSDIFDIGVVDDDDESGLLEGLEGDSTAEMRGMALDDGTFDLPEIGQAMDKHDARRELGGRSADPVIGDDTAEQPAVRPATLSDVSGELSAVDFDIGVDDGAGLEPTAVMTGRRRGPDGPTMTEVGTKLDLARAYVDMGDPDGARSILNEVIEEGDSAQRQEARRLLDDLTG